MRQQPTDAEACLWARLRNRQIDGWKFRRQVPFGGYVLDFYCAQAKLAIEVDGGQHADECKDHDDRRTAYLRSESVSVLRFWNHVVLNNIDGVLEMIYVSLGQQPALSPGMSRKARHADLSPEGRGEDEQARNKLDDR